MNGLLDNVYSPDFLKAIGIDPEKMKEQQQNQGLLSAGLALLAGSGPSTTPTSLGQLVAQAGSAGIQAMRGAGEEQISNAIRSLQVKDFMAKQKAQQTLRDRLSAAKTMVPTSVGLTPGGEQEKMLAGQLEGMPDDTAILTAQSLMSNQNLPKKEVTDQTAAQQAVLSYLQEVDPTKYLELTAKQQKQPSASIQEYNLAKTEGYKGTLEDWVTKKAKAGTSTTNVNLPGDKKLSETLGKAAADRLDKSLDAANAASTTLQTINDLRPNIQQGVFAGPLSGNVRAIAQIASSLNITGESTNEMLKRTAQTMQGLAKFELDAAAAMRGQGAITENERNLIKRAAAGDLANFTSAEILSLMDAMEKTSKYRISSHNKMLDLFRKSDNPEVRAFVPLFEIGSVPTSAPSGSGVPQGVTVKKVK